MPPEKTKSAGSKAIELLALGIDAFEKKPPEIQKVELVGDNFVTIKGKDGKDGVPGSQGEKGERGERGTDGKDGATGKDGRNGIDGKDGRDGVDGKTPTIDYKKVVKEAVKQIPPIDIEKQVIQITEKVSQQTNDTVQSLRTKVASRTYAMGELSDTQTATTGQTMVKQADGTWAGAATSGSSPLTTKGDLYTRTTVDARLAVGTDGQVLSSDSTQPTGLKWIALAGGGDMLLATVQTVSALKTYLAGTLGIRNVANTFTSFFTNTNTASRTYTLKDADGTIAFTSDITGTNSGINTGDQTITLTGEVTGSGTGSFATTLLNSAVIGKILTGLSLVSTTVISATDTILVALGSLQAQITLRAIDTTVVHNTGNETVAGVKTFSSNPVVPKIGLNSVANLGNAYIEGKTLTAGSVQGMRIEADNAANIQFSSFITGDSFTRFSFLADGTVKFGSGAVSSDTNLYRNAADSLITDDKFTALGGLKITNASTSGYVWTATDTIGNGSWQASAGGATAPSYARTVMVMGA